MAIRFKDSPLVTAIKIGLVILTVELAIMLALQGVLEPAFSARVPPYFWEILDPILLTLLVAPVLNLWVIRPLRTQKQRLREQADELRIAAVAFDSQNGMLITNADGVILRVNKAFTRLTGYTAEEAIGHNPSFFGSGRHDKEFYRRMWSSLVHKGYWRGEIWNRRKSGQIYAELLTVTATRDLTGKTTHYIGSFTDITEDKEAVAEIHRLAYYDALTKLPNRRLILDRAAHALTSATRTGRFGAIYVIDLDNFKLINDTRGHDTGDKLLIEVASRFRATLRESETVGRQGGDEFFVLAEDLGDDITQAQVAARHLADRLKTSLQLPVDLFGYEHRCRMSMGVCLFGGNERIDDVMKRADLALYQAKEAGRNNICFFDLALEAAITSRKNTEVALGEALGLDQLQLYYQPQIDAKNQLLGAEVLLRWAHPHRGLLAPADFLSIAEDTGLIIPIGDWVLQQVCAQIKLWSSDPHNEKLQISVNVSARQFRNADFADRVREILETHAINPQRLKIELTETHVLDDVEDTIMKVEKLRSLGVMFSMDDFGTGYSSLAYLAQLPIDQLKIDRSFVRNIPGRSSEEMVAKTIITLARGLGVQVIAEGVENTLQREFLELHGCDAFQGYLFSRPITLTDFESQYLSPVPVAATSTMLH
ncbi:MAG: EAL domain-containing protein [Burkholderiales bacterium]|nr:EAL domain-containing protein [Burkholderiales bacterium]